MTPRTWATKKVAREWGNDCDGSIADLLLAEHQRALRIVKGITVTLKKSSVTDRDANFYRAGALQACDDILAALQRGRTGRGK